jgi:thiamine-monophosphate kinase
MKSVLVNLSDLAAMGADPFFCLLGLALPEQLKKDFFNRFIEGFCDECDRYSLSLVGGDLTAGCQIQISVTVVGVVEEGEPVYRSTAKPGDQIFLIGSPGHSRAGLEFLKSAAIRGLERVKDEAGLISLLGDRPETNWIKAHLLPRIMLEPARWLRKRGLVNSMIDVSDGLGNDMLHILQESHLQGEIQIGELPEIPGISEGSRWRDLVLNGGEDYCLVGTCDSRQAREIRQTYPERMPQLRFIGQVSGGNPELYLSERGEKEIYQKKGYDHFP